MSQKTPWLVSLHGSHSGQFCDHAKDDLRDMIERAIELGFSTLGLSEHCPRFEPQHLYDEERRRGWDASKLEQLFLAYSEEADSLIREFGDKIDLLKGFEAEFITDEYPEKMLALRRNGSFDYIVGSVHHVDGYCIDGTAKWFEEAIENSGGLENLAIKYYQTLENMVTTLSPEVVGHFDLITKIGDDYGDVATPKIKEVAFQTLQTIKKFDCILDLNVYPLRRGKATPYPAPWVVQEAKKLNIPFCFGDDSHARKNVGVGILEGRNYLVKNDVKTITCLTKSGGTLKKTEISLESQPSDLVSDIALT